MDYEKDSQQDDSQNSEVEDYAAEYRAAAENFPNKLRNVARFGVNRSGVMQEVTIPEDLQGHRYIQPMLEYINSSSTRFSPATADKYASAFRDILRVASEEGKLNWFDFGRALLRYLEKSGRGEFSVKDSLDRARRIFSLAEGFSDDQDLKRGIRQITGVSLNGRRSVKKSSWPNLRKTAHSPKKSVACVFGNDLDYTNDQYIKAFTEYSCAFITAWSDIRREIREFHPDLFMRVRDLAQSIGIDRLKEVEQRRRYPYAYSESLDTWVSLFSLELEVLEALNNKFLNWSTVAQHASTDCFEKLLEIVNLPVQGASGYTSLFKDDGIVVRGTKRLGPEGNEAEAVVAKLPFSLMGLFGPTVEEEICFIWLLSTRRIQISNIQRLTRQDIDRDKKTIWVRTLKGRNRKAENTPIPSNSRMGRAVRRYLEDHDRSQEYRDGKKAIVWRYYNGGQTRFANTPNFSHLAMSGNVEGIDAYGVSDHSLRIMKDLYAAVTEAKKTVHSTRVTGRATFSVKSLSPNFLCQSAVYAEEAARGNFSLSPDMRITHDQEDGGERELLARSQFHSTKTREEIYRARSRDKIQIEKDWAFSAQVSQEMANMAEEIIGEWSERASCLSVDELVALVGLRGITPETPPETVFLAAKAENFVVETSGLIRKNGKIYLFDSGLTARLMIEEIRHLEGELDKLFLTQDTDKAVNVLAKCIFLGLLMDRLSAKSLIEAKEKYGHLEGKIPHAPISEGGKSWIVE